MNNAALATLVPSSWCLWMSVSLGKILRSTLTGHRVCTVTILVDSGKLLSSVALSVHVPTGHERACFPGSRNVASAGGSDKGEERPGEPPETQGKCLLLCNSHWASCMHFFFFSGFRKLFINMEKTFITYYLKGGFKIT